MTETLSGPPARQRLLQKPGTGGIGGGAGRSQSHAGPGRLQRLGQRGIGQHMRQPVRTQQQAIPGRQIQRGEFRHRPRPHGAGDDIRLRVIARRLGGQPTGVHQFLHQRMIARQPRQPAIAQQIGARVPRPCQRQPPAPDDRRDGGGADHRALALAPRRDQRIRRRKARGQGGHGFFAVGEGFQRIDHPIRGIAAQQVPAHSIGHRPDLSRGIDQYRILVLVADGAAMGQPRPPDGKAAPGRRSAHWVILCRQESLTRNIRARIENNSSLA